MRINLVNDVGAPLAVTAVELITETTVPQYNEWAAYLLAIGGYAGSMMGYGGDFVKNVGIASMPWAAKKVYDRVKSMTGGTGGTSRLALRRVAAPITRYPAPSYNDEFAGIKLT